MTYANILAELPTLSADERDVLIECLCNLQSRDLVAGDGPSNDLKKLLDKELEDYKRDGDLGTPWQEVLKELLAKAHSNLACRHSIASKIRPAIYSRLV